MGLVVLLFGPPGAGKTTIARAAPAGFEVYDRDDPQWAGESTFLRAIRRLRHGGPDAVVIRSGARSRTRQLAIGRIGATHAYLVLASPAECHQRAGHRRRTTVRHDHAAIDAWFQRFDHDDQLPTWPGWQAIDHHPIEHAQSWEW